MIGLIISLKIMYRSLRHNKYFCPVMGGIAFLIANVGFAQSPSSQPDWVEITISLRDGRYYEAEQLARQVEAAFGEPFDRLKLHDPVLELTPAERAGLILLAGSSWGRERFRVEITDEYLKLSIRRDANHDGRKLRRHILDSLGLSPPKKSYQLILPDPWKPERTTIVLVHGLESSHRSFDQFADAWRGLGWQIGFYIYPNDGPISDSGQFLSKRLKDVNRKQPKARFIIIATSMGGLVSRYCLEMPGMDPGNVTELFMLATPNHGSLLAWGQPLLELLKIVNDNETSLYSAFFDGMGEAGEDLMPDSAFLQELNAQPRNPKVTYHLALADRAFVVPGQWTDLVQDIRQRLNRQRKKTRNGKLLRLLDDLDEVQTGLGDGAVALKRGRLRGVKDTRVFHRRHLDINRVDVPDRPQDDPIIAWILQSIGNQP